MCLLTDDDISPQQQRQHWFAVLAPGPAARLRYWLGCVGHTAHCPLTNHHHHHLEQKLVIVDTNTRNDAVSIFKRGLMRIMTGFLAVLFADSLARVPPSPPPPPTMWYHVLGNFVDMKKKKEMMMMMIMMIPDLPSYLATEPSNKPNRYPGDNCSFHSV